MGSSSSCFYTYSKDKLAYANDKLRVYEPSTLIAASVTGVVGSYYLKKFYNRCKENEKGFLAGFVDILYNLGKHMPLVGNKISSNQEVLIEKVKDDFMAPLKNGKDISPFNELPAKGLSYEEVMDLLKKLSKFDVVDEKKTSGAIYYGDDKHVELTSEAYKVYSKTNPLHMDYYPATQRFEREVIRMCANLMHGDRFVCGIMTSGGTESIFLSVKAYRDYFRKVKPWIKTPEIIIPESGHPGFDKAAKILCMKLIKVDCLEGSVVDLKKMKKFITKNTVLLVGSAPSYPCGVIDPIEDIAKLGLKYKIPVHVDSCLGGFYLPFAYRLNLNIPKFDFLVDGVTSISTDTHKFGMAPKGTSVLLFKNSELRNNAFYSTNYWVGGFYMTPTLLGSRSGGLLAGCWSSLVYQGMNGFLETTQKIHNTVQAIVEGVKKIEGIRTYGECKSMIVSITKEKNEKFGIFQILDKMAEKGWKLNPFHKPNGFHFCVCYKNVGVNEEFLKDLRESVDACKKNPDLYRDKSHALYGLAAVAPEHLVETLSKSLIAYGIDGTYIEDEEKRMKEEKRKEEKK